jgi:AcrR family transcriptional regulator
MTSRKVRKTCPRPYTLGKRQKYVDQVRVRILDAARGLLANEDHSEFSMDAVARQAGITRQTIHNQFGTKSALLEALFDRMAMRGGMAGMPVVMQQTDPVVMLRMFVETFAQFWTSDRVAIRRIHALAVLDSELGRIDRARNDRRRMAANRVLDALYGRFGKLLPQDRRDAVALLFAITSFEFFDSFVGNRSPETVCPLIVRVVMDVLGIPA